MKDKIMLFFHRKAPILPLGCIWTNRDKLVRLANQGKVKMESEFDMLKIIKNLRDVRIMMKN
jgi:hypothetical protein